PNKKDFDTMRKLKVFFAVLIAATLLLGITYKGFLKSTELERTEFLFDTVCSIKVYSKDAKDALVAAFDEATQIHLLTNFFDQDSDVSKINNAKSGEAVSVSPEILELLELSERIHSASDGAFDITIAPVASLWKFDIESPKPPSDEQITAALRLVGRDSLALDKSNSTVTKSFDETKIDLGGIAKGYAADKVAEVLKSHGIDCAIIDFGGNIVAFGKNPKTDDGKWRIGLQSPFSPTGEFSKTVEISSGAVVTSGTYQRFFEYEGEKYHHIIDPKTGKPSTQSFDSVTVTAESAALADALATAAFVLGEEKGTALVGEFQATLEVL
ncbi:MAG: FAD:protein FMN transferase, partial [Clostridia bacterium]|nr:FAD:protein FMN transferase [Clostridia bacterium]